MINKINKIVSNVKDKTYIPLHCHNTFSELDGFGRPDQHTSRAKEMGLTHLAITNHNHLAGMPGFQETCKNDGIKPILGCELYYTPDTNILSLSKPERDKIAQEKAEEDGIKIPSKITKKELREIIKPYEYNTKQYHILFLAKNQNGWKNLVRLQSEAAIKCTFNGRFLADNELLRKHSEDIICTTACLGSYPAQMIISGNIQEAENIIDEWHDIYKDNFYLEIQPLMDEEQAVVNQYYMKWSEEKNIKLVATNDVHYPRKEDNIIHDILLCIGTKKEYKDKDRMKYDHEFWIKSYDEMIEGFINQINTYDIKDPVKYIENCIDALYNTKIISNQIDEIELGSPVPLFPNVELPKGLNADEVLELESFERLYGYAKEKNMSTEEVRHYEERLKTELEVIKKKNYSPYFLAVEDFMAAANARGCSTGPSRGSAAGSFTSFINDIVKVTDPVEHDLLFFRFLTEDRTSPPDIDIDFCYRNRYKVIEYLEETYGADHVCHIGTMTELGVKNGIKDVARVLGLDFKESNLITKQIDAILPEPRISFKKLDKLEEENPSAYNRFVELENKYQPIFKAARQLEGNVRNTGVHAAGVLVTPFPVTDLFPIKLDKEGKRVALYTGDELEDLNAIKFDLLGLKTITVIEDALKMIDENLTIDDMYKRNDILQDPKLFEMIKAGNVEGLFQIESDLFKMIIKDIQPDRFEEIVALTAICRPGPLSAGMHKQFADRKFGREEIKEPLPNTMDIVDETYGTLVYQEHLMLIAKRVAHFDDNQSDTYLRKATANQRRNLMDLCRQWFVWGKKNEEAPEGYDPENKDQVMYDPEGKYGAPILGGINNEYEPGKKYKEEDLIKFWNNIEGFCSYLFNKSHSVAYSVLTMYTAWLKYYYPSKFMASLLSMENNEEKVKLYTNVCSKMNIDISVPDINNSKHDFTEKDGNIMYGFSSVKGVGGQSIPKIIESQPYKSLEDVFDKVPKKYFNKRVGVALIKAGAFDDFEKNRLKLLNEFHDIRKDKDERYNEDDWSKELCMEFEKEVLKTSITHKEWINKIPVDKRVEGKGTIKRINEIYDKNQKLMAFIDIDIEDSVNVSSIAFSRTYVEYLDDFKEGNSVLVRGKKDDKNTFIISSIKSI